MAGEIQKDNSTEAEKKEEVKEAKETAELARCQKERDEYLAGWQRARADFLNYKKDEVKRFEEIVRFSNEELLKELIGVLDSFDLGLAALEKEGKAEKGIYMIRSQLEDILKQHGLERIQLKVGDKFDPATSETIAESESDKPAGEVIEIIEVGYRLNGKLLRPARVKVSKQRQAK